MRALASTRANSGSSAPGSGGASPNRAVSFRTRRPVAASATASTRRKRQGRAGRRAGRAGQAGPKGVNHRGDEQRVGRCGEADAGYLRGQLQEARWLLKGLEARGETLLRVVRCLMQQQAGFLEFGEQALRPLTLRDENGNSITCCKTKVLS